MSLDEFDQTILRVSSDYKIRLPFKAIVDVAIVDMVTCGQPSAAGWEKLEKCLIRVRDISGSAETRCRIVSSYARPLWN